MNIFTLEEIDVYLLTKKGITMNIFEALFIINEKLSNIPEFNWAVVGSMATAIQGCDIIPGDIDIWISRNIDVEKAVNCFKDSLPEDSPVKSMNDNWRSSNKQPIITFQIGDSNWTFGRVYMNNLKIDIAHAVTNEIQSYSSGVGIWENGPDISCLIKVVHINGHAIPVVPLEVQLQTNFSRGNENRIVEIIKMFRTVGYDQELLIYCLDREYFNKFSEIQKEFIQ